jgi:hypothetical protein
MDEKFYSTHKAVAVVPNDFYDKQIKMASWHKKDALALRRILMPLIGKRVVLYGGGGWSGEESIGILKKIDIHKPTYYSQPDNKPYTPKEDIYIVDATLHFADVKDTSLNRKSFTPHLGSWKIAKIEKK